MVWWGYMVDMVNKGKIVLIKGSVGEISMEKEKVREGK